MITVELTFDDNPERLAARPAHRQRLVALHERGVLVLAGPWADDSGALLVFDADRSEVDRELAMDPYYATVRVVALREWLPVVP